MSFLDTLNRITLSDIKDSIYGVSKEDVAGTLSKQHFSVRDFNVLVSPAAAGFLETMAMRARSITLLRFGRTVKLYAPVYVSNECVNACAYCGFNVCNQLQRVTLTTEEVLTEADALYSQGFRHILLVSGEDRHKVPGFIP